MSYFAPTGETAIRGLLMVQATFGQVLAFEDDLITEQLLSFGAHMRCELALLSHFIDSGDTILDIGAHIGTFTVPFAQRIGAEGCLVAIELDPRNYALLVANTRLTNTADRVKALNVAVGNPNETYKLARHARNTAMSHTIAESDSTTGVRGTTLDELTKGERQFTLAQNRCARDGMASTNTRSTFTGKLPCPSN